MYSVSSSPGLKIRPSTYRLNATVWEGSGLSHIGDDPLFIGPQGATGLIGQQGPEGMSGTARSGSQGPQGIAGPTGHQGSQGPFSNIMTDNVFFGSTGLVIGSTLSAMQAFHIDTIHGCSFIEAAVTGDESSAVYCASSLLPFRPNTYSLGSTLRKWNSLHVYGNTIYIGGYAISTSSSSSSVLSLQNPLGNSSQLINTSNTNNRIDPSLIPFSAFKYGFTQSYGPDTDASLADFSNQLFSMIALLDPYYNGLVSPIFPSGSTLIDVDSCIDTLNSAYYIIELKGISQVRLRLPVEVSFPIRGGSTGTHFVYGRTVFPYEEDTFVSGEIVLIGFARNLFGTELIVRVNRVGCHIPESSISSAEIGTGAVTFAKLQASSVQTQNIQDFCVPLGAMAFDLLPLFTSGVQGTQGLYGIQGQQGLSGPQGLASQTRGHYGYQGGTGTTGPQGAKGLTGFAGTGSVTGRQGAQGAQGPQGQQGEGPTGPAGTMGPEPSYAGEQGLPGMEGDLSPEALFSGPIGPQGRRGAQGRQGSIGSTATASIGFQGSQGISTYVMGMQGVQSFAGPRGFQSVTGSQSVAGPYGLQGVQQVSDPGPQGCQGAYGYTGLVGMGGRQGRQGTVSLAFYGPTGYDGGDGEQGQQGQGATGTVVGMQGDVNSLVGKQGSQGSQGPDTLNGFQGQTGMKGVRGSQGAQGFTDAAPSFALTLSCTSYAPPSVAYQAGYLTWGSITNGFSGQTFNTWSLQVPGSTLKCPYSGWYEILVWGEPRPSSVTQQTSIAIFLQLNDDFVMRGPILGGDFSWMGSQPVSAHFISYIYKDDLVRFGSYSAAVTAAEFGTSDTSPLYLSIKNLS